MSQLDNMTICRLVNVPIRLEAQPNTTNLKLETLPVAKPNGAKQNLKLATLPEAKPNSAKQNLKPET